MRRLSSHVAAFVCRCIWTPIPVVDRLYQWARAGKLAASNKGRARLWYKSSALEGIRANLKKGAADGAAAAITLNRAGFAGGSNS
jgi:hypothetical protein